MRVLFLILVMCLPSHSWSQSLPENASKKSYGSGWKCNSGFYKSGNQCAKVKIPKNAELNVYGSGWKCNSGFYKSGNQCAKVKIPKNAGLNVYGSGWKCNSGFYKSGNQCAEVKIPKNAGLNVYGSGWKCNSGFYKSGNQCAKVKVPKNASLNVYGSGWKCNKKFKKEGNNCAAMSPQELQKQQQLEKQALAEMQRIKSSLSDGTIAFQTKIDSDSGDIIKLENGAIVEVSSYFGYLGYRKTAVLYGAGHRCNIWIAGKKSYKCDLLKSPDGRGDPAKVIHISEVKGNGTILFMLDGSMYEVDSIDEIYTSLWLGISDGLLINGSTLINFDADESVTVNRIK